MSCVMLLADIAAPHRTTGSNGLQLYSRILEYSASHKAAPASLAVLRAEDVQPRNFYKDGWGRPFQYTLEPEGTVTLASLGKDGVAGAANGNGGFTWHLLLKNQDGSWIRPEESGSAWHRTNGQK
jgi:hypothetical protein